MPNFNLSEYKKQSSSADLLQVPTEPRISSENTAYAASAQSAIFDDETNLIHVVCDADAFMLCAANPTALASSRRLLANVDYWFEVPLESSLRMAFYDGTS